MSDHMIPQHAGFSLLVVLVHSPMGTYEQTILFGDDTVPQQLMFLFERALVSHIHYRNENYHLITNFRSNNYFGCHFFFAKYDM